MGSRPRWHAKDHLKFKEIRDTGKTKVWEVSNAQTTAELGIIKWHGAWRKYCFFPEPDTLFDNGCLERIVQFMDAEMAAWRAEKKK